MRPRQDCGIDVRLLGPFEVAVGGRLVEIGSPKQRGLLAMLVVHRNRALPLDVLAEELWGDHLPVSVAAAIQTLVYRLRRVMAAGGAEEGDLSLRASGPGYRLEVDDSRVDSDCFEELVIQARKVSAEGDTGAAAQLFRESLSLWRGPALEDLADRQFARAEAARLNEARIEVVEELAEAEMATGRATAALALLEPHLATHPLREQAWGQLMVCLYRLGRQAEALRAYQDLRRVLGEELGLEPTPSLRRLEQQILEHRPELDGPRAPKEAPGSGPAADTFAFLFTDIEASTRRWEGDQEAMAADLARHDELLEEAVVLHGGHLFTHTGDGLGAAFPTASAALAAAVAGQRALLGQMWMAPAPLRVRMAVHAGAAEPRQGTYFGPTLNRIARLLEKAAAGQIVCSLAAADLARDKLPADVVLLDLGEHRLPDLSRPERIYQVAHPELPSAFPPVRSPDAALHNLPMALTSFVGREGELEELDKLLGTTRLLTLTGLGGAGKTRLALELARRARERFLDGVWFIELGALREPSLVAPTVMAGLGILAGGLGSDATAPEDRLCEYLRARTLLIVLDNCEHLVRAAADLVHTVLARCPNVAVLATSREILGVPGEVPWSLSGLSLPGSEVSGLDDLISSDAVALFCARASTAQPGFGLTDANASAVVRTCRRLDGIPLALELAAARIRVLGAHQLAERLEDRFRLLTGGIRATTSHHETLQAAMDWSYQLLSAPEQALLRRLSVFPQSFDLEAVEGVGADEIPQAGFGVLDVLARLVDKSLVMVEGDGGEVRYRLLETVRQYGAERLAEAGDTGAAQRLHRDFFLSLADGWRGVGRGFWEPAWVRRVIADRENFHAAVDWSLAQRDYEEAVGFGAALWRWWDYDEMAGAARHRLERALAGSGSAPTWARVQAMLALARSLFAARDADPERARALIQEALPVALASDDTDALADVRFALAQLAYGGDEPEEGHRQLELALAAWAHSPGLTAWCLNELGWAAMAAGDVGKARSHFERALALEQQGGPDELLRLHLLAALAPIAALGGEPDRAERLAAEAIGIARNVPLPQILVVALTRAAEAAVVSDRRRRAMVLVGELLALLRDVGARRWVAHALETTALVLETDDRIESAARFLRAADSLQRALGESATTMPPLGDRLVACRNRIAGLLGHQALAGQEGVSEDQRLDEVINQALDELALCDGAKSNPS
jgi:predicted ATPase/DNA-binding SARP family transcriptional activator